MFMKSFLVVSGLVLTLGLSSCQTSSSEYIEGIRGYSVTRGRITKIENLHAEDLKPLSDGLVMTVVEDGCRVTMRFREEEDDIQIFDIGEGVILVHGCDGDYILESRADSLEVPTPEP